MSKLPILFLENFFLFPTCDKYLSLENNPAWKNVILQALINHRGQLLVFFNKEKNVDYSEKVTFVGSLGKVSLEIFEAGSFEQIISSCKEIKLQGLERVKITNLEKKEKGWEGEYEILLEKEMDERSLEELTEKFIRHFSNILEKTKLGTVEKFPYMTMMRGNIGSLIDFIAQNSQEIDPLIKWKIFSSLDLKERLELLINLPDRQKIESDIEKDTREQINNQQEEYFLREKLKAIEKKLRGKKGREGSEMSKYLDRLEKFPYPDYVKKVIREEIDRYDSMPSNSSEANIIKQYVDCLVNLPWWQRSTEVSDLNLVRHKLDEKHYGLTKPKDQVVQYLAAQQQAGKSLGKVLLLAGPAGVGKSSFAASVAEAMGRKFGYIPLGGVRDVALIQGFQRTYVGSKPGILVKLLKELGVINPVVLIDEVDKVAHDDYRGSILYALLAVLDSGQNKRFVDHYLEIPIDLSQVMFICTANNYLDLPRPLLNRMRVIHLSSYTELEKFQIAQKCLIPNNLKEHNLQNGEIIFKDQAVMDMIRYYTWEAGVRKLDMEIQTIIEKFSEQLIKKEKEKLVVSPESLKDYLGKRKYEFTRKLKTSRIGVATGLAWTENGGDIMPIEVACYPRKEGELELTGNLGDIMKESAHVALNYIKANQEKFGIESKMLSQNGIHIHVPEGATPKEGPSAGIALTSAIISALTNKKVPQDIGMTGEITLHGHVKEIGGLKEKAIAAHRSGLKTIIIPKVNEKDVEDIPLKTIIISKADKNHLKKVSTKEIRESLIIFTVEEYEEVWKIIFAKSKEKKDLSVPIKTKLIRVKRIKREDPKQRIQ